MGTGVSFFGRPGPLINFSFTFRPRLDDGVSQEVCLVDVADATQRGVEESSRTKDDLLASTIGVQLA